MYLQYVHKHDLIGAFKAPYKYYCSYLPDETTKACGKVATCPRSHSLLAADPGLKLRSLKDSCSFHSASRFSQEIAPRILDVCYQKSQKTKQKQKQTHRKPDFKHKDHMDRWKVYTLERTKISLQLSKIKLVSVLFIHLLWIYYKLLIIFCLH